MSNTVILGIDPGAHGAMSVTSLDGSFREVFPFHKVTYHEIARTIELYNAIYSSVFAYVEEVHSMPKDGKVQAFTFGRNYGIILGVLIALKIPIVDVLPNTWQTGLKLRTRGLEYREKKRALKLAALKKFPQFNVTLDTADALLIAEYGRLLVAQHK